MCLYSTTQLSLLCSLEVFQGIIAFYHKSLMFFFTKHPISYKLRLII